MTEVAGAVVRRLTVVAANAEGVAVFTERLGDFKPPEHNLLAAPIAETVFEPRVGGHIYDRAIDGTQCHWARVLVYEPPRRVVFSWDIGPTWQLRDRPGARERGRGQIPSRRPPTAPASNSSTGTSTGTVPGGRPSPRASATTKAGRCTSRGTRPCSARAAECRRTR